MTQRQTTQRQMTQRQTTQRQTTETDDTETDDTETDGQPEKTVRQTNKPCMRKPSFWFPTWSDTNQAVQLQKMDRCSKFRIKKVDGLFYLCSENKGADQLRGYREADLRLCFRICKTLVFSWRGSNGDTDPRKVDRKHKHVKFKSGNLISRRISKNVWANYIFR